MAISLSVTTPTRRREPSLSTTGSIPILWSFINLATSVIGVSGVTVLGSADMMSWIFIEGVSPVFVGNEGNEESPARSALFEGYD
jgi:hypothetical protein